MNHFGTYNNALIAAGLKINHIYNHHSENDCCFICKRSKSRQWYYRDNNLICTECYRMDRNYIHGKLNPTSSNGIGVITEYVVFRVLNDCIKCNVINDFHNAYDLISEKYGTINVKSSILSKHTTLNNYRWKFDTTRNLKIPNTYICVGFDEYKSKIMHMWIIPENSKIIANTGIYITKSDKGLSRAYQYEIDPDPYNTVYQNLDIYTLPEFCNLNKSEEVFV